LQWCTHVRGMEKQSWRMERKAEPLSNTQKVDPYW
jgi:hypothetical protein